MVFFLSTTYSKGCWCVVGHAVIYTFGIPKVPTKMVFMRKLTLILSLMFIVTLSSPSYAKWTKVDEGLSDFYVDFERIRKVDGYVYFWMLIDYLKPSPSGDLSAKVYKQGDCKLFREKILNYSTHREPMGGGKVTAVGREPEKDWKYPTPNSVRETILKTVCALTK